MESIRNIRFLETRLGHVPFYTWYESLKDKQTRLIVASALRKLQNERFLNFQIVSEGVFELRIFYGPGYRVYFGFENRNVIVICAGNKTSQRRDIKRAVRLWRESKYGN